MKRTAAMLMAALFCWGVLSGCAQAPEKDGGQQLAVYSFCGENEQIALSNGVIVLGTENEVFYGGNLTEKPGELSNITAFSITFYIVSGNEKWVLLSNRVEDTTGGTISISGSAGKISGEVIPDGLRAVLEGNLYLNLQTRDLTGQEYEYQLPLAVTEVTEQTQG